jgi:hypothetical protein
MRRPALFLALIAAAIPALAHSQVL